MIDGFTETMKVSWEQTRLIAFIVGKFGNSDPKKFPKSVTRFLPFAWDQKVTTNTHDIFKQHAIMKAKREEILKKNASRRNAQCKI